MLADLYPLLRAVQPADLNTPSTPIATALEGRGDRIGENIETLDWAYLTRLNRAFRLCWRTSDDRPR